MLVIVMIACIVPRAVLAVVAVVSIAGAPRRCKHRSWTELLRSHAVEANQSDWCGEGADQVPDFGAAQVSGFLISRVAQHIAVPSMEVQDECADR